MLFILLCLYLSITLPVGGNTKTVTLSESNTVAHVQS